MKFILNGIEKTFSGDPKLLLLTYLREQEGIISPKDGCAPQAACGCCVVELNLRAVLACGAHQAEKKVYQIPAKPYL